MDYEKAYKDALERAKKYWNSPRTCVDVDVIPEIFPELAESEDERIRKLCEALVRTCFTSELCTKEEKDECIAWLEKQGENMPIIEMKSPEESLGVSSKEYNEIVNDCLYREDKVADKIEQKFKVGDWITNDYCAGKIIELTNDAYLLDTGQGIPFSCEHNVHLWTIQDAKDGDVLVASDDSVFIYAGSTDRYAQFYIALSKYGDFNTEGGNWEDKNCVKPATKEQRDLLFQKMKEAGYTFNSEKKELKKIHVIDEGKAEMDYCFTKMMNGEKVSSAWSKEDEKVYQSIIDDTMQENQLDNEQINWLKSLKQRIGG